MRVLPNLQGGVKTERETGVGEMLDEFSDHVGPGLDAPGNAGHPWAMLARKRKQHDLTGQRFGRLVGVRYSHRNNRGIFWEFRCDCGNSHTVVVYAVFKGTTKSCGCIRRERKAWANKLAKLIAGASNDDLLAGVSMINQELRNRKPGGQNE